MENKEELNIDEYTRKVFDLEFDESPNSVDLRSCCKGDQLKCRDGSVMYYQQPLPPEYFYDHEISFDKEGKRPASRTNSGKTLKASISDTDIVEIIRKT